MSLAAFDLDSIYLNVGLICRMGGRLIISVGSTGASEGRILLYFLSDPCFERAERADE